MLVKAFAYPRGRAAQLLALFAYGRVSLNASGHPHDEINQLIEVAAHQGATVGARDLESLRAHAERQIHEAERRKQLMEEALEQYAPSGFLLATSPPLVDELMDLTRAIQRKGYRHMQPSQVRELLLRCAFRLLTTLDPASFYLGAGRFSEREYLIQSAIASDAHSLVTDDPDLQLPGGASHSHEATRREVRPYTLDEFIADEIDSSFSLDEIDAEAVLKAAVIRLHPEHERLRRH